MINEKITELNSLLIESLGYTFILTPTNIEEFDKNYIANRKNTISIKYKDLIIPSFFDLPFDELHKDLAGLNSIDQIIYSNIKRILSEQDLNDHINNIVSIVQYHIYLSELLPVYMKRTEQLSQVAEEFYKMSKTLDADINEIRLLTPKSDESCRITNPPLLKVLTSLIKIVINENPMAHFFIQEKENGVPREQYLLKSVHRSAALNLLVYIQNKTNYYNVSVQQATKADFNNKQYSLVGELLATTNIISDDNDSPLPNIIRNWIKRSKNIIWLYLFDKEREKEAIEFLNQSNPF